MLGTLVSMILFAFVGAVSPGPVNLIATSAGAGVGFWRTLPYVLGATLGYTLVVLLAGMGLAQLLQEQPLLAALLRYLGAAFLLYMALRIALAPVAELQANPGVAPSWWQGALTQWLNPKAWLVAASGVGLFVTAHEPVSLYLMLFCALSFAMCLLGVGLWAGFGTLLGHWLNGPRQRRFNRLMGLLLAVTVVGLFLPVAGGR
ncbi:LysE family translocator [Zobellella iuensis]|uniref:LysE family translocator n=1 Tax=Zobellella iuensis TaxID=2803811 RepID=A0ABS1QW80_9GAMM|nr:LysE family translocator [Zobellella iuensis]MBL1379122.1 LysE family translocator [Zobellella iuensis]